MQKPNSRWRNGLRMLYFLLILAVFIGLAPASLTARWLETRCAGLCRLADSEGRWWSGAGNVYLRAAPNAPWQALGRLRWQTAGDWSTPWAYRLTLEQGEILITLHKLDVHVSIRHLRLPASPCLEMTYWQLPIQHASGWLSIPAADFQITADGRLSGRGELNWSAMTLDILEDIPLGTLQSQWSFTQWNDWQASFSGGETGKLNYAGEIRKPEKSAIHLSLSAALLASSHFGLEKYLHSIGAQPNGEHRFNYRSAP